MIAQSPNRVKDFMHFIDFPILYFIQKVIFRYQINSKVFMWWHNFQYIISQRNRYIWAIIISPYHDNRFLRNEFIPPLGAMSISNI